ncbi:MAG: Uma2 family endonuclease [Treponema sp.]|nr:Uma2 family endonuclease [Treponema sp.]
MADAMELREDTMPMFRRENLPAHGYTYKDYYSWGEDVRCELIDGVPYMLGAPTLRHQMVAGGIYTQLMIWLEGKPCRAFIAPTDVRLFHEQDESDRTVVQPDVLVVCDESKLSDGRSCRGAPDFVVEVVSEGSVKKDFVIKKDKYEKAGVREYWAIDDEEVRKYELADGRYRQTVFALGKDLCVDVGVLPGCRISFKDVAASQ